MTTLTDYQREHVAFTAGLEILQDRRANGTEEQERAIACRVIRKLVEKMRLSDEDAEPILRLLEDEPPVTEVCDGEYGCTYRTEVVGYEEQQHEVWVCDIHGELP